MESKLNKIVSAEKPKAAAFLQFISSLNTLEITWMFGMIEDRAEQSMKRAEEESMRHEHFGRKKEAAEALDRMDFYRKCLQVKELWRDAEMEDSLPGVIAAIRARSGAKPPVPPRKKAKAVTKPMAGRYEFNLSELGAVNAVSNNGVHWEILSGESILGSADWELCDDQMRFINRINLPFDGKKERAVHTIFDDLLPQKIQAQS